MPQSLGPLLPALPAATLLDRHEQGEVVQPGLLGGERLELLPQPVGGPRAKTLPCSRQQGRLALDDGAVIDAALGQAQAIEVVAADEAPLGKRVGAGQEWIA